MNYYQILANSSQEQASRLASMVLHAYSSSQIKLLSGPKCGLVMLRVRETVANSQFNAGEILVTEVKLELDGQFGFGMVIGDSPRHAMAIALIDAALRKGESVAKQLEHELGDLYRRMKLSNQHMHNVAATTRVNFETL